MNRRKPGFTLVEMLVAMTLLVSLMTVVALALGSLARADRRARIEIDHGRAMQQLFTQMRADAHQATAFAITSPTTPAPPAADGEAPDQPESPTASLRLTYDAGVTIDYRAVGDGIRRVVTRGSTVRHHEVYSCGPLSRVMWTVDEMHELPLLTLQLERTTGVGRQAVPLVVQAALLNTSPQLAE